jgi:hypothetical protein
METAKDGLWDSLQNTMKEMGTRDKLSSQVLQRILEGEKGCLPQT